VKALGLAAPAVLHVRLPGADPDLADEDILEDDLVGALDGHLPPLGRGLQGRQNDLPLAVPVGLGRLGLSGEPDGDSLPGSRGAPHRDRHLALEHHVVAEHGRRGNVREDLPLAGQHEHRRQHERYSPSSNLHSIAPMSAKFPCLIQASPGFGRFRRRPPCQ